MPVPKANQRAVNKYKKNNYDRIEITVPKGQRDVFQAHAAARGESTNAFIGRAIQETMERDKAPQEVIFGRAVDVIANHYEVSPWDVLDELKGLDGTESPSEATGAISRPGVVSEAIKTAQEAAEAAGEVETQAQRDKLGRKMKGAKK